MEARVRLLILQAPAVRTGTQNWSGHTCEVKIIPGDYLLKLIKRMPRVCKAVIKAKGGYFEEPRSCNVTGVTKSTRCAILRDMAKVRKAEKRPPLYKKHEIKRQDWAKKYLKTDFSKVLWTDEMRATLDGPDGWIRGWISKGQRAPLRLRRQQGGGGVLVWAGIIKDELVGPFRVEDGVKMNSQTYCQFLEDNFFKQWYRKKSDLLKWK
ncbi:unnamed protein product [Ranitomeya imitator]|uniref:Transposase n=1 Tax=Ranitomeya imitator TaxID=111125 RepID=A0ABN9LKF5_9NEOB|nr:unnamed protein product [Ranitomeya imitator]